MRYSVLSTVLAAVAWTSSGSTIHAAPQLAVDVVPTSSGVEILPQGREPFDPDGAPGWRMADRFRGFRFVVTFPSAASSQSIDMALPSTAAAARKSRCFGWIQVHTKTALVGEARCPKPKAELLLEHIRTLSIAVEVEQYANTKIRYHFPNFRVLTEPRYVGKTCFPTALHACSSSASNKDPPTTTSSTTNKDEL